MNRMLDDWWADRTPRERVLLRIAAIAALLALALQFAFLPAIERREAGARRLSAEIVLNAEIERALAFRPVDRRSDGADRSLQAVLSDSARGHRLRLGRLRADADGAVAVSLAGAPPDALFAWLDGLREGHGVRVRRAAIGRADANAVDAELLVVRVR